MAALIFIFVGTYGVFTSSHHCDEDVHLWASAYLVHQLVSGDTQFEAKDVYLDPHWDPGTDWALGMGASTRILYGLALALTPGTAAPTVPYGWTNPSLQGPETSAGSRTLIILRFVAVFCGALGIALVANRFGWSAVVGVVLILALPGGIASFSRAWAEGPLLLAFGLCAAAYGTRWFSPVLGLGLTFKLTALGLWPLVFFKRARVVPLWQALVMLIGTFVALTPSSWVTGGPLYVLPLINYRIQHWVGQSTNEAFVPSRYVWPFELLGVIVGAALISRLMADRQTRRVASTAPSPS